MKAFIIKNKILLSIIGVVLVVGLGVTGALLMKKETYEVKFTGADISKIEVMEGNYLKQPEMPQKEGYEFAGWYLNGKPFDFNTPIEGDITLEAKWKEIISKLTVEEVKRMFDEYKEKNLANELYSIENISLEETEENVYTVSYDEKHIGYKKEGMKVTLEYKNGKWDFELPGTSGVIVKEKYTVTFDSNGGSSVSSQEVEYDGVVTKPKNPTRTGYKFAGWQIDGQAYNFNSKVINNITLTAKWTEVAKPEIPVQPETPVQKEVSESLKKELLFLVGVDEGDLQLSSWDAQYIFAFENDGVVNNFSLENKNLLIKQYVIRKKMAKWIESDSGIGSGEYLGIEINDYNEIFKKYGFNNNPSQIASESSDYVGSKDNCYLFSTGVNLITYEVKYDKLTFSYDNNDIILNSKINLHNIQDGSTQNKEITYRFKLNDGEYYLYSINRKDI